MDSSSNMPKRMGSSGPAMTLVTVAILAALAGCTAQRGAMAPPEPLPTDPDALQPYTSRQLDSVAPEAVPRMDDEALQLPVDVTMDPLAIPAYNGADAPTDQAPMSLEQVYSVALTNDPVLRGAYNELQAMGYGL